MPSRSTSGGHTSRLGRLTGRRRGPSSSRPFFAAFAVMVRIRAVFADKGYDAEANRELCRAFGAEPQLHKRGRPHGSGLGKRRWPVERSNAWLLENKRLALRYDRQGFIIQSLLQADCLFLVVERLAREL